VCIGRVSLTSSPGGALRPVCSLRDVSLANNAFSSGILRDVAVCVMLASLNLSSNRASTCAVVARSAVVC
jgi:hypothetical protein